ncbi:MAG: DMT family transporter [Actinomycetota bacterium]|nr:DMT family transporter [Actinomycetota bacterium]
MNGGDGRVVLAAFVTSAVLAGGNAVAIRFSNRELDPLWGATLRFSLAAALLVGVMAVLRLAFPRGIAAIGAVLYGSLNIGAAFGLAYYALVELQAGFGQIVLALVPLATLVLAVLQRQERLRFAALVGALLGLAGIFVMSRTSLPDTVPLVSLFAAVGSALCFAQAAVVVRRFPRVHPVTMNATGMATGAALLLVGSALAGETRQLPRDGETWAALAYLAVVGSVVVFVLYLFVLERWSASRTSYQFLLIPVVTVALSAWLDDEAIGLGLVFGGLLVFAGVYVGVLRPMRE